MIEIWKEFTFDAAHHLPNVPQEHKCHRLHGHTYRVRVYVAGPLVEGLGWVVDFADIAAAIRPVLQTLDHAYLNEIPGLENPTCEVLARYMWPKIRKGLPQLAALEVSESSDTGCRYDP